jgi:endonuclease/exonuclease/phosphatase family metal-dependent hydrolase
LDKAFVRGGLVIRHLRVVRSKLAKAASDHLPLVIDFHFDVDVSAPDNGQAVGQ